ncbi:MAG TPA: hypothetical protein VFC51_02825, partial [Chloroflexota bacterium]|nr:hypothetical protein [Chloroflexota bacterium]
MLAVASVTRVRGVAVAHAVVGAVALCGVGLGLALRGMPVLANDFPLNDGGLFSVMIEAVRGARYGLPWSVTYNGLEIPFAYPPLGFVLGALLADLTHTSGIAVLRWLPLALNLFAMGAFALLARAVLRTAMGAVVALGVLMALPGSYEWLIGGGGLTRSLGLLFALLALREAYLLATRGWRRDVALLAVCSGLALLSHLEMAWFLAYSAVLVYLGYGRTWGNAVRGAVAAGGALILAAPWWVTVLARYGPGPFVAAAATGSSVAQGLGARDVQVFAALALALFAALAATRDERLSLLAWVGAIWLLNSRSRWLIACPLSLALGRATSAALIHPWGDWGAHAGTAAGRLALWARPICAPLTVAALGLAALAYRSGLPVPADVAAATAALTREDRSAMGWLRNHTSERSRFIVVGGGGWAQDRVGEWLPVLGGRVVDSTIQGTEWLPGGE